MLWIHSYILTFQYGSGGKIICTLVGHSKRVNSLRWLSGPGIDKESELVSGSADGTVCVWTLTEIGYKSSVLRGHETNVNIVDGLYKKTSHMQAIVVSVSMDCTANIWTRHFLKGKELEWFIIIIELKNVNK